MLGLGRAIGETIAVTLVIGNAPTDRQHLFDQGYTLAAVIANEFGEAATTRSTAPALIAAGLVLFVADAARQRIAARALVDRGARAARRQPAPAAAGGRWPDDRGCARALAVSPRAGARTDRRARLIAAGTVDRARPARAGHLLPAQARASARWSWHFFTTDPTGTRSSATRAASRARSSARSRSSRWPRRSRSRSAIGVALYLVEYGKQSRVRQRRALLRRRDDRRAVDRLRPVHLHRADRHRHSASFFAGWKGSVALALLMLPVVIRSAEVVLLLVPDALREAALALGAPRWRVDHCASCCRPRCPGWSPARCWPSRAPPARPRRCCSPPRSSRARRSTSASAMNSLPAQIFNDVAPGRRTASSSARGARR